MLILSRKCNERILIGDDIIITVVHLDNGTARLGVEAPKHITILREELCTNAQASVAASRS